MLNFIKFKLRETEPKKSLVRLKLNANLREKGADRLNKKTGLFF